MAVGSGNWVSLLIAAFARGEVNGGELWDLVLAHADDPDAEHLVDRVLARFRSVLAGPGQAEALVDDDLLVVGDDEPGLLAG